MSDLISKVNSFSDFSVKNTTTASTNPIETKTENDSDSKKKNEKIALIAGSTALAAAAATGIYLVLRGKAQKVKQIKQELEISFHKAQKEFAKFENGKALANSGENFTGQITKNLKDGSKVVIKYENGILQSTRKFEGETQIYEKVYRYNEEGKLSKISKIKGEFSTPETVWKKYVNEKGFTVTRSQNSSVAVNKATKEMVIGKTVEGDKWLTKYFKDGKVKLEKKTNGGLNVETKLYKDDGKTVDCMVNGDKFIDSKGNSFYFLQGDCIRRPNGTSSSYNYRANYIKDSDFVGDIPKNSKTAVDKIPRRYKESCDPITGIVSIKRTPDTPEDLLGNLINRYTYKKIFGENKEITVLFDFIKPMFKGTNKKRELDDISVLLRGHGFMDVLQENGKFLLKKDKELLAVFNPKTKAFEALNMPEERAKMIMETIKEASDQLLKDRKDYLRAENMIKKMYDLGEYVQAQIRG